MSNKITIPVGESPIIQIESIGEDLRVRGHDQAEIVITADDDEAINYDIHQPTHQSSPESSNNDETDADAGETGSSQTSANESIVEIGAISGDSVIDIPANATLRIHKIGGDAQIRSVNGHIQIDSVGEDLSATKIGALEVTSVGGDASIKRASGSVTIENVGEDASCTEIEGNLTIKVGADLSLSSVQGNVTAKVGEDAMLRFPLIAERQYNVIAGGDIGCYLPADTSAEVMLRSGTRTLRVRGWEVPEPPEDELYTFTLGEGAASLNLNAGEDISLVSQESKGGPGIDFDFDFDFGPGFQFRFDSDSGFRPEQFSNLFSEKIQAKVQSAMRHAEESIANAISNAESRISNAEKRAESFENRWSGRRPRGPKGGRRDRPAEDRRRREHRRREHHGPRHAQGDSAPDKAPVTEAERLMVLRMVEEGKISVEQAEKLLSAMGS